MAAEVIPPEIAKTLVGWRKHINTHTLQGRFNSVMLSLGSYTALILYFGVFRSSKPKAVKA